MSLNLCADELVLRLAGPARVVSVTWLAQDPTGSTVADLAQGLPVNRGLAEEIVPLGPDLVIAGAFTTRTTVALLKSLRIPHLELGVPRSVEEAYAEIRKVANALGEPERGEAMVAALAEALEPPPAPRHRPTAIVLRPNGFTAGRDTLADELMARAGLDNLAARLSPDPLGQLPLEEIVRAQPDLFILDTEPDAPPSLAQAMLAHPVLAKAKARRVDLPTRLWACVGPQLADAFARLKDGARESAPTAAYEGGRSQLAAQRTTPSAARPVPGAGEAP